MSGSRTTSAFVVKRFKGEDYTVVFNAMNGFFARVEDVGCDEPFWATHGPELMDIAITNWCDRGCTFCYRKSTTSGRHISLKDYEEIIRQAREMEVFQVALGGGNPNQHPDFAEILRLTREDYGIVPNYTTNGRGLSSGVLEATAEFCGAVAVSAYAPYQETSAAIDTLHARGVAVNVHFIISNHSVDTAIEWLNSPPKFLENVNAIVFLNYKPVGRFADNRLLLNRSSRVAEFFHLATTVRHSFRVGFDTCTVTGLARLGNAPEISVEGCDAGRFSMFVSEDMKVYPCSYMVETDCDGISLRGTTLKDIWRDSALFESFRDKHAAGGCPSCTTQGQCLSGCPLFPEINLCPENCA